LAQEPETEMSLLSLRNVSHAYGLASLLDDAEMTLQSAERVCLLGRNGTGKSTLLKLVAGELTADEGLRECGALRIGTVPQTFPDHLSGTAFAVVRAGTAIAVELDRYTEFSESSSASSRELQALYERIDAAQGWSLDTQVNAVLEHLSIDGSADVCALSGGQKRRVLLARAMVDEPELLILDEPTNHLDMDNIQWLETWLKQYSGCCLFTTHDRRLIENVATRILELDRGQLSSWPGNYGNFLRRRLEREEAENRANERADKLLAQEEAWIRQGIKARRTRNEGRVRRLEQLRAERSQRRDRETGASLGEVKASTGARILVETIGANLSLGGKLLVRNLDLMIMRGDRVGIVGANGSGKTSLLRMLLGELNPDSGSVRKADTLSIAYFDQFRELPNENSRVRDQLGNGSDFVGEGERRKHVVSYLQDFMFAPERANAPVSVLSGGERARLALARLFEKPSTLLALDEPTNDLDVETLELLEERLLSFDGTLLVVTHDRTFLDNTVASLLVMNGEGSIVEHAGGYSEFVERQAGLGLTQAQASSGERAVAEQSATSPSFTPRKRSNKLSFREQRELAALPELMESLEAKIGVLHECLADPDLYRDRGDEVQDLRADLARHESELEASFERWETLEAKT
jgi:ATP-binding cassette subfamily F protein uup